MAPSLPEDVFAAEADGTVIFLDLKADRYLSLARTHAEPFMSWARGEGDLSPDLAERLTRAGLLSVHADDRAILTQASPPRSELAPALRAAPISSGAALAARMLAQRALKRRTLYDIIAERRRARRPPASAIDSTRLHRKAAAFAAGRPFASTHDACLREALALLRFLGPMGGHADWVFGVTGAPFAAHCWVEFEGCVLNDTLDHARIYAPIMVA